MTGRIPPFFFFTENMVLMKLGGGGNRGTSSMAPLASIASTSKVDVMVVCSMRWSGETYSRAGERGRRREKGTITFHGLEQMRGGFQHLPPEGKEVAQSAPDP
jgi:hypothetical protein